MRRLQLCVIVAFVDSCMLFQLQAGRLAFIQCVRWMLVLACVAVIAKANSSQKLHVVKIRGLRMHEHMPTVVMVSI